MVEVYVRRLYHGHRPKAWLAPVPSSSQASCASWAFGPQEALRRQQEAAKRLGLAKGLTLRLGYGVSLKLVLIPPGTFLMGSPHNKDDPLSDAYPQYEVTITKPFYMGIYDVTQAQYQAENPGYRKNTKRPANDVSWKEAVAFCRMLSRKTGRRVHLPTEAQWEYACRAGTATPYYFGKDNWRDSSPGCLR